MVLNRVALTGASGMLGRHVLAALHAQSVAVTMASRSPVRKLRPNDRWSPWDLTEWRSPAHIDELFLGAEAIIHAGAHVPAEGRAATRRVMVEANIRSCLNLAEWAQDRSIPMVFVSGAIVYGDGGEDRFSEESPRSITASSSFYGLTKLHAEEILEQFRATGLRLVVLRPSSIYGAGLPEDKMICRFLSALSRDETLRLEQSIEDSVSLVHAADVARAILIALRSDKCGIYNIGSEQLVSIREIAATCQSVVGRGRIETDPRPTSRRPARRFNIDCTAARKHLGFAPWIRLRQGLAMTWQGTVSIVSETETPHA